MSRMNHLIPFYRFARALTLTGALALLLTACGGPKNAVLPTAFFPPLPDEPRLQYLTSYSDSGAMSEKSKLRFIVTGEEKPETVVTIDKPLGIAVHKGVIYVCDTHQSSVIVIDPVKKRFEMLKGNAGPGKLKKPLNLAVDEDGTLYVADNGRNEVMIYDANGDFVRGVGRGLCKKLVGVAVGRDRIFLVDFAAHRVRMLNKSNFENMGELGKGTSEDDSLWFPYAMALDSQGDIYVTNIGDSRVLKLDIDNHALLSFGKLGDAPGMFSRPRGIAVDKEGRIWVVDAAFQNVQIFNEKGRILLNFGDPGAPQGSMNIPAGIALSQDYLDYYQKFADPLFEVQSVVFVTNQSGYDMVTVYGFGRYKGKFSPPPEKPAAQPEKPAAQPEKPAAQPEKPAETPGKTTATPDQEGVAHGVAAPR